MNQNPILAALTSPLLAPAAGGGQAVTLYGQFLSGARAVQVGANQVTPTSTTATSVTFQWPPNAASATPYDIAILFSSDDNEGTATNTLHSAVYYLPAAVSNAWYAAEFYSGGIWTDLIAGVQEAPFTGFTAPAVAMPWSNGQPALYFNGTRALQNSTLPALAQPGAIFVVGQTGGTIAESTYFGGNWSAYQTGIGINGTPTSNAGTALSDTADLLTSPSIAEYVFNGASSSISVNGGTKTVGNAGTNALAGLTLGAGDPPPLTGGYEALVLVYAGVPSLGDEAIINAIAKSIYAPVTATLVYTILPVAPVTAAQLLTAVTAVDLQEESIQTATGCTLVSDTTVNDSGSIVRTITFLLTAQFQSGFTAKTLAQALATGAWASPFNNLYTHTLGATLGSAVEAAAVAVGQSF